MVLSAQKIPANAPKQRIAEGRSSSKGQEQPQPKSSDKGTPPLVSPSPQLTTPTCDESCQQGRQNLKIQNSLALLTGALVLVGLLQVCGMVWQAILLKQTRGDVHAQAGWMKTQTDHMSRQADLLERQTTLAEQSSQSATDSLRFFINAERAKITMDITERGRSFLIRGKNTGKAVAQITLAHGYSAVVPHGKELPLTPPYLSKPQTNADFIEWTSPGEFIDPMPEGKGYELIADLSDLELCSAIRDEKSILWIFGRICYGDGISPHSRETRFCYEVTVDEHSETGLVMSGPAIYRLET